MEYQKDCVEALNTLEDEMPSKLDKPQVLALIRANEDALLSELKTKEVITDYTLAATADGNGVFAVDITK